MFFWGAIMFPRASLWLSTGLGRRYSDRLLTLTLSLCYVILLPITRSIFSSLNLICQLIVHRFLLPICLQLAHVACWCHLSDFQQSVTGLSRLLDLVSTLCRRTST